MNYPILAYGVPVGSVASGSSILLRSPRSGRVRRYYICHQQAREYVYRGDGWVGQSHDVVPAAYCRSTSGRYLTIAKDRLCDVIAY